MRFVYCAFPLHMEGMYARTFGPISVKSHFGLFTNSTSFSEFGRRDLCPAWVWIVRLQHFNSDWSCDFDNPASCWPYMAAVMRDTPVMGIA